MTYRLGFLLRAPPHHLPDGHPTVCFYDLVYRHRRTSHLPHPSFSFNILPPPPLLVYKRERVFRGLEEEEKRSIVWERRRKFFFFFQSAGTRALGLIVATGQATPHHHSGGTNRWMSFTRFGRQDERGGRRRTSRVCVCVCERERERREEEIGREDLLSPASLRTYTSCAGHWKGLISGSGIGFVGKWRSWNTQRKGGNGGRVNKRRKLCNWKIYIEELSTIKSLYAVYTKRSQERTIRFFSNKMFLHFFFFYLFFWNILN